MESTRYSPPPRGPRPGQLPLVPHAPSSAGEALHCLPFTFSTLLTRTTPNRTSAMLFPDSSLYSSNLSDISIATFGQTTQSAHPVEAGIPKVKISSPKPPGSDSTLDAFCMMEDPRLETNMGRQHILHTICWLYRERGKQASRTSPGPV